MPGSAPNPSILSHVSLGTNQFEKAVAFYDQVLGALGIQRFLDLSAEVPAVAFGRAYPEFWIQAPCDGKPAETANGVHVAFYAATTDEVDAFYRAALAAGAKDEGRTGQTAALWRAVLRLLRARSGWAQDRGDGLAGAGAGLS